MEAAADYEIIVLATDVQNCPGHQLMQVDVVQEEAQLMQADAEKEDVLKVQSVVPSSHTAHALAGAGGYFVGHSSYVVIVCRLSLSMKKK